MQCYRQVNKNPNPERPVFVLAKPKTYDMTLIGSKLNCLFQLSIIAQLKYENVRQR